jgi:hypothetical protein
MPAINSAGKAAAPRQEETEQEGERGQSPRQRGLLFHACIFSEIPSILVP